MWVLTLRKIKVASGELAEAHRAAAYPLSFADSPAAFPTGSSDAEADGQDDPDGTSALWLGAPRMLERLGVHRGAQVGVDQLALALQGRNAMTGERVRREGWIQRDATDPHGRPLYDEQGRRVKVGVHGTKSVDLTFSAPKSVSVVWSQAGPELRARIEPAMLAAADAMLECMTMTKPVVAHRRVLGPAHGFAAAAALHVTARTAKLETVPSPQLHVHGVLVGVERADGFFASPELSGMFRYGAPLEGGAVARAKLAELLVEMGFEIDGQTGRAGRFFEIKGVPLGLLDRMSSRTRDVEAGIREREAAKGKRLTNGERAVVALQTRAPKSREPAPAQAVAAWRATAEDFDFVPATVAALRRGSGFAEGLDERRESVRAAVLQRVRDRGTSASVGELRAAVLESAAGRLRLDEASTLLRDMENAGELPAV